MKISLRARLLCVALAFCGSAALAQDEDDADYSRMMDQAMKSGTYTQSQAENWDARLKVVSGSVMVKPSEAEEWVKVTGEMPLDPGDLVKTASDGVAELYLDDKGAVGVGRNTEVEVSSLDQGETVFSLSFGSLAAKIKHFLNEKFKLQVRTPSAVCAVRGTEFAVEYSQLGKDTSIAVFDEGRVVVTPTAEAASSQGLGRSGSSGGGGPEDTLEKNTELSFGPSQKRFRPVPLAKMARYKGLIGTLRKRVASLKGWRPRSPARRAELRNLALKRKIRRQIGVATGAKAKEKARAARRAKAAAKRSKARRAAQSAQAQDEE